jgi:hypothetical protein
VEIHVIEEGGNWEKFELIVKYTWTFSHALKPYSMNDPIQNLCLLLSKHGTACAATVCGLKKMKPITGILLDQSKQQELKQNNLAENLNRKRNMMQKIIHINKESELLLSCSHLCSALHHLLENARA